MIVKACSLVKVLNNEASVICNRQFTDTSQDYNQHHINFCNDIIAISQLIGTKKGHSRLQKIPFSNSHRNEAAVSLSEYKDRY